MIKAVAKISTGTNGHRYSGKDAWVLVAAISRVFGMPKIKPS